MLCPQALIGSTHVPTDTVELTRDGRHFESLPSLPVSYFSGCLKIIDKHILVVAGGRTASPAPANYKSSSVSSENTAH
jgi:hypothetical protein